MAGVYLTLNQFGFDLGKKDSTLDQVFVFLFFSERVDFNLLLTINWYSKVNESGKFITHIWEWGYSLSNGDTT